MSGYGVFSNYYDLLNADADYEGRTAYMLKLFDIYGERPRLMLDFACGTGAFSRRFAKEGIEVIGVDPSAEMLSVASSKSVGILYLNQDGKNLELYGTVDGAICCLDSINHITEREELMSALRNIALYLEKGKLFIFDLNTVYKHRCVLADNCFTLEEDGILCVWQNSLCDDRRTVEINLDFFEEQKSGSYKRYSENFFETAYSEEEMKEMLSDAGFDTLAVLGDMSFDRPAECEERVYFVAVRR